MSFAAWQHIRAFSSGGERFPDTEEVTSSNLVTPTINSRQVKCGIWPALLFFGHYGWDTIWTPKRDEFARICPWMGLFATHHRHGEYKGSCLDERPVESCGADLRCVRVLAGEVFHPRVSDALERLSETRMGSLALGETPHHVGSEFVAAPMPLRVDPPR